MSDLPEESFVAQKTYAQKTFTVSEDDIERSWWVVDAEGQNLGRLATRIATILRGKHKPTYSPHLDVGDYVIVINCEKIAVTGNKLNDKVYYRHSQYPGGLKQVTLGDQLDKFPERVIEAAVRGMLPKNALGRKMFRKLKVHAGPTHPHEAQQPKPLEL
ncbi:MAG: 50S ribosomal protein L13 [Chloroflexi bacterium]|nr:MAG: 50S ribosomal protein L13 [Phototrophicales bacterium]RMF82438.1 MAG: 50S ribosomal protein L13 [Chloroflexota bacterium]